MGSIVRCIWFGFAYHKSFIIRGTGPGVLGVFFGIRYGCIAGWMEAAVCLYLGRGGGLFKPQVGRDHRIHLMNGIYTYFEPLPFPSPRSTPELGFWIWMIVVGCIGKVRIYGDGNGHNIFDVSPSYLRRWRCKWSSKYSTCIPPSNGYHMLPQFFHAIHRCKDFASLPFPSLTQD